MNFLDWLDAAFGVAEDVFSALLDYVLYLVGILIQAFVWLFNALVAIFGFGISVLGKVLGFLKSLWKGGLAGFLHRLSDIYRKLRLKLFTFFKPLLDYLHHVREFWRMWWGRYIRPLVTFIHRLRAFLKLLRLFHVKWASKLDGELGKLETKLNQILLEQAKAINSILDTLNLILDPLGIFDPGMFLGSVGNDIRQIWAMLRDIQERKLFASEEDQIVRNNKAISDGVTRNDLATVKAGGHLQLEPGLEDSINAYAAAFLSGTLPH